MSETAPNPAALPGDSEGNCLRPYFLVTKDQFKNNGSYKQSWCRGCLSGRITAILDADRAAVIRGDPGARVRSDAEADTLGTSRLFLYPLLIVGTARGTTVGMPISSSLKIQTTHVRKCGLCVPADDRARILEERRLERDDNSRKRARPALGNITNVLAAHPGLHITAGQPLPSAGAGALPMGLPSLTSSVPVPPGHVPLHRTETIPDLLPPNATDIQKDFAADLCRMFVALNLAWNAAANPELKGFFARWLPNLRVPDRRSLSGPLLRAEKQKAAERVKSKVHGQLAMLQCDGWKNVARMNVLTSMMTVNNEVHALLA